MRRFLFLSLLAVGCQGSTSEDLFASSLDCGILQEDAFSPDSRVVTSTDAGLDENSGGGREAGSGGVDTGGTDIGATGGAGGQGTGGSGGVDTGGSGGNGAGGFTLDPNFQCTPAPWDDRYGCFTLETRAGPVLAPEGRCYRTECAYELIGEDSFAIAVMESDVAFGCDANEFCVPCAYHEGRTWQGPIFVTNACEEGDLGDIESP